MNLIPQHVAIIMDGNGRWGIKNRGSRILGHQSGVNKIQDILKFALKNKIKILTLYTFSINNWRRKKNEIKNLFDLFKVFYQKNNKQFSKDKIYIKIIGENRFLPKNIILIKKKINKFKITDFKIKVNIAFNYSSKFEMLNAFKKAKIKNINSIEKKLYTYPDPYPEILIRTGNTHRLSDFLLWQCSYSEVFFLKKLWPDFKSSDFKKILKKYNKIKRNFGSS